nr:hypothetical protein [Tanacetum cinerariifolium]
MPAARALGLPSPSYSNWPRTNLPARPTGQLAVFQVFLVQSRVLAVGPGRAARVLAEEAPEVRGLLEAQGVAHLGHRQARGAQQVPGLSQHPRPNELAGGAAQVLAAAGAEVVGAEVQAGSVVAHRVQGAKVRFQQLRKLPGYRRPPTPLRGRRGRESQRQQQVQQLAVGHGADLQHLGGTASLARVVHHGGFYRDAGFAGRQLQGAAHRPAEGGAHVAAGVHLAAGRVEDRGQVAAGRDDVAVGLQQRHVEGVLVHPNAVLRLIEGRHLHEKQRPLAGRRGQHARRLDAGADAAARARGQQRHRGAGRVVGTGREGSSQGSRREGLAAGGPAGAGAHAYFLGRGGSAPRTVLDGGRKVEAGGAGGQRLQHVPAHPGRDAGAGRVVGAGDVEERGQVGALGDDHARRVGQVHVEAHRQAGQVHVGAAHGGGVADVEAFLGGDGHRVLGHDFQGRAGQARLPRGVGYPGVVGLGLLLPEGHRLGAGFDGGAGVVLEVGDEGRGAGHVLGHAHLAGPVHVEQAHARLGQVFEALDVQGVAGAHQHRRLAGERAAGFYLGGHHGRFEGRAAGLFIRFLDALADAFPLGVGHAHPHLGAAQVAQAPHLFRVALAHQDGQPVLGVAAGAGKPLGGHIHPAFAGRGRTSALGVHQRPALGLPDYQLPVAAGHVGDERQQLVFAYLLLLERIQALRQDNALLLEGRELRLVGLVLAVECGAVAKGNQLDGHLAFQAGVSQRVTDVAQRLLNQLGVIAVELVDGVVVRQVGGGPGEGAFLKGFGVVHGSGSLGVAGKGEAGGERGGPELVLVLGKLVGVRGVGAIDGLLAQVGVVLFEVGHAGPGLGVDKGRDVVSIGIGEDGVLGGGPEGHVGLDKAGGRLQAVHAGPVVVAVGAPQGRVLVLCVGASALALAARPVAAGTLLGIQYFALAQVGRPVRKRDFYEALALHLLPHRHLAAQPLHIGYQGLHLLTVEGQRAAVEAAGHAAVDAVFEGLVLAEEGGAVAEGHQFNSNLPLQPRVFQRVVDVAQRLLNELGVVAIELVHGVVVGLVGGRAGEGAFLECLGIVHSGGGLGAAREGKTRDERGGRLVAEDGVLGGSPEGHVSLHEAGGRLQAVHAGPVIVAVGAPQRRVLVLPAAAGALALAARAVTAGALLGKNELALAQVGGPVGHRELDKPLALHFLAHRHLAAQPFHVRHHGLHLLAVKSQRLAVEAARHAAVDAVFECADGVFAALVGGVNAPDAHVGSRKGLLAGLQMAVLAGQVAAGQAQQRVLGLGPQVLRGVGNQLVAVANQLALGVVLHAVEQEARGREKVNQLRPSRLRRRTGRRGRGGYRGPGLGRKHQHVGRHGHHQHHQPNNPGEQPGDLDEHLLVFGLQAGRGLGGSFHDEKGGNGKENYQQANP